MQALRNGNEQGCNPAQPNIVRLGSSSIRGSSSSSTEPLILRLSSARESSIGLNSARKLERFYKIITKFKTLLVHKKDKKLNILYNNIEII